MSQEKNDIDERIKKQQEILYELDKHYQECTLGLIKQVEQLEQMVNDLKKSSPNSNTAATSEHELNMQNNNDNVSIPISTEKKVFSNTIDIH